MWLAGGPFYSRADVIELRRETIGLAKEPVPEGAPRDVIGAIASVLLGAFAADSAGVSVKSAKDRLAEIEKALAAMRARR
jgi:hypothetical protein